MIRITTSLSIPQHRSSERGHARGNGCRDAGDLEIPSFQSTFDNLGLPWNETSPEQGYPNPSVDDTLLEDEEDDHEEENETGHDEQFVHPIRLLESDHELFRCHENVV